MFYKQKQLIISIMQGHKGKANPIPRTELVSRVQFDEPVKDKDRVVREILGEIREEGLPIINSGNGQGYFIAITESEFEEAINRAESYLVSFSKDVQVLKKAKDKLFGEQTELTVEERCENAQEKLREIREGVKQ